MRRIILPVVMGFLCVLFFSCATCEQRVGVDNTWRKLDMADIVPGKSTQIQIAKKIGPRHSEGLIMTFDQSGFITSVAKIEKQDDLGAGGGIQFFFVVTALVDSDELTGEKSQHDCGQDLLNGIAKALNTNQNLETGNNGLQQLGTPDTVGQHTLEK